MNRLSKVISAIILIIAVMIATGCTKTDESNIGGGNGNNNGNGDTPEIPAIVSTSEVQYDGIVYIEAVFENESKMYFEILSPNEVALVSSEYFYQDNPSLAYMYRGEVVIPETITHFGSTYTVTSIAKKAFYNNELVISVYIPNSVISILSIKTVTGYGEIFSGAFQGCTNLNKVHMSDNIIDIGPNAFAGCLYYKESVTIPKHVKSIGAKAFDSETVYFNADSCNVAGGFMLIYYESICYSAFPNMNSIVFGSSVKELPAYLYSSINPLVVDIPPSVTILAPKAFSECYRLERVNNLENIIDIGEFAFYQCNSLKTIELNSTLTTINVQSFGGCCGLTSIEIPNSVTSIGGSAFSDCTGLTSIEIPNSVTSIGGGAFSGCSGLVCVELPNSVSIIDYSTFYGCSELTSVEIPNSVTSIGRDAFYGCSELTSVVIPNSVTMIGSNAFYGCRRLTEIFLPSSIRSIGNKAFSECNEMTHLTCMASEPPVLGEDVFKSRWMDVVYVPMPSVEAYKTAVGWSEYADVIVGI